MKFSIPRSKLLDGLQRVQNVVAPRSSLQVLANVLIKAEADAIWLTTTDMDMSVRCRIETEVEQTGETTLPVRRLLGIVRELTEGDITIDIDEDDQAKLEIASSYFRILGLPAAEFPPLPDHDESIAYVLDQGTFREMLRKTAYAASMDETRQVLNGVLMAFKDGKLTLVATDGRRLALVEQEVEFPPEAEAEMILPNKAVNELMRILRDHGELRIAAVNKQVIFDLDGNTRMSSKLVDGVYPNYRQVIPAGLNQHVAIDREAFLTALKRVSLVNTEKSNATKMTFEDNHLTIISATPDVGEARETLPVKFTEEPITIIFNTEYVMDPLRNLESDEVIIEMNDGNSPALMKCHIPFLYVLMPLRVGGM